MPDQTLASLEDCGGFLENLLKEGATYADVKLYLENGSQIALRATSSDVQVFDRTIAVARAIYGKAWGIHVLERPNKSSLQKACAYALKLAKVADSISILDRPIRLKDVKQLRRSSACECRIDPSNVDLEEKISFVKDLRSRVEAVLKDSYGWSEVVYGDAKSQFSLANSEGTHITESAPSVDLLLYVTARSGEVLESAGKFMGFTRGFEAIEEIDRDGLVRDTAERSLRLASGKMFPKTLVSQKLPTVMDSDCAGAFIHEAVAHPAEADFMLEAGSVFQDKLDKRVAVSQLTVYDDASMPGQYGTYAFDDEAVEATKVCVIDKGILRTLLHTRHTAAELDAKPTGSAHGLTHIPRSLMSNTYIEPRDWKQEELVEETKKGILIEGVIRAESTPVEGLFMIQPESTTIIRNGERRETIRGARVTGLINEALNKIEGIGNKLRMRPSVEKEFNISDGGPPIKVASLRAW